MRWLLPLLFALAGLEPASGADRKVEAELQAFWQAHNRAFQTRDIKMLDRLLAPEFKWVHAFGYVDDKATVLREAKEDPAPPGRFAFDISPPRELTVSGDIAILTNPLGRPVVRPASEELRVPDF